MAFFFGGSGILNAGFAGSWDDLFCCAGCPALRSTSSLALTFVSMPLIQSTARAPQMHARRLAHVRSSLERIGSRISPLSTSCSASLMRPLLVLYRFRLCEFSICEALSPAHAAAPAQLMCPSTFCELSNAHPGPLLLQLHRHAL